MSFGDHGDCKCAGKTREQVLALFPKTLLAEQALYVASKVSEGVYEVCLLYTSPSPRDRTRSRMPSSA